VFNILNIILCQWINVSVFEIQFWFVIFFSGKKNYKFLGLQMGKFSAHITSCELGTCCCEIRPATGIVLLNIHTENKCEDFMK